MLEPAPWLFWLSLASALPANTPDLFEVSSAAEGGPAIALAGGTWAVAEVVTEVAALLADMPEEAGSELEVAATTELSLLGLLTTVAAVGAGAAAAALAGAKAGVAGAEAGAGPGAEYGPEAGP